MVQPYFEKNNGKLYCGDSLKILPIFEKESIPLIIIDPPFNCLTNWGAKENSIDVNNKTKGRLLNDGWFENDNLTPEEFEIFITNSFQLMYDILKSDGSAFIFCDYKIYPTFYNILNNLNFKIKNVLIWDKIHFGLGGNWRNVYEMIIFATKNDKYSFYAKKDECNIIREVRLMDTIHPTEKPVPLLRRLIRNCSKEGDTVLDFFAGSGSTLVASNDLKRNWIGVELSEDYCKKIKNRLTQNKITDYKVYDRNNQRTLF